MQGKKTFAGRLGARILFAVVLAAAFVCGMPGASQAYGATGSAAKAESDTGGTVLSNDALFRSIVRLHPQGKVCAVNVEDNGSGSGNNLV